MFVPVPVLAGLGLALLALLVLVILALRRRGDRRDLIAPPRMDAPAGTPPPQPRAWPAGAAPIGDLPPDVAAEVRTLMQADRKIDAIKLARQASGLSLADAKALVERL